MTIETAVKCRMLSMLGFMALFQESRLGEKLSHVPAVGILHCLSLFLHNHHALQGLIIIGNFKTLIIEAGKNLQDGVL